VEEGIIKENPEDITTNCSNDSVDFDNDFNDDSDSNSDFDEDIDRDEEDGDCNLN
jgi:hypothetical protein